MADGKLQDKVALITGGGTGIGRACAERFAAEGARIAVMGRRKRMIDDCVSSIQENFGKEAAMGVAGDVAMPEDVERVVEHTLRALHRIDILVNNAGVIRTAPLTEIPLEHYDFIMDINVRGAFLMARRVAHFMQSHKSGNIVNISSTLGSKPAPGTSLYSASKAALNMFTRAWALDLAEYNVRVNCICPGVVDTPIHEPADGESHTKDERLKQMSSLHPLGRIGQPEEIAKAALYFASDDAAWTTGAILDVDGGVNAG